MSDIKHKFIYFSSFILANKITFNPEITYSIDEKSYYCVIQKLMIEWEASEALTEASGKLMCTMAKRDERVIKKNNFIMSFTKTPGLRFTEVFGGPSKAIPISHGFNEGWVDKDGWRIEEFCLLPYFEDGSLNIKNCSLEIEFLEIERYDSED